MNLVIPVLVFTSFVIALAALVLLARRALAPTGVVAIAINGRRSVDVPAGRPLLTGLADAGIFLPSACGGRGTCGDCRVRVTSGAPALLATEAAHIDDVAARQGDRLACLLKPRGPLEIALPDQLLEARRYTCTVTSTQHVATFLKQVTLALPEGERLDFHAGDYVMLEAPAHELRFADFDMPPDLRAEWDRLNLSGLRSRVPRPVTRLYSLGNAPHEGDHIVLVVRIATPPPRAPRGTPPGQVSSYIFGLKPGDTVAIAGPYGSFHVADTDREIVLIGGGAGIAPLRAIVRDQLARGCPRRTSLWYGARNLRDLCYADEFEAAAAANERFGYHVALSQPDPDDAWDGPTGFIHTVVRERYLADHDDPTSVEYYLCGPPLMSAAVVHMLGELGVPSDQIHFDDFDTG